MRRLIARTQEAQDAIQRVATRSAKKATVVLKAHRHDGHSFIEVKSGRIDRYIVLNDDRGQKAAMTIEFGRRGGNLDKNGNLVSPMDPVAPLRKGVGLL